MTQLSAFDLDGTLLRLNSSFRFGTYLYQQRQMPFYNMLRMVAAYARHRYGGASLGGVHERAFQLFFRGREQKVLARQVSDFLDQQLTGILYQPAIDRLRGCQQRGDRVVIYSSGADFVVGPLAARLGVECWQASRYVADAQGRFTAMPQVLFSAEKAKQLHDLAHQLKIPLDRVTVYSDSICDLPFLQAGGKAVAVKPDRSLRRHSLAQGWEIL